MANCLHCNLPTDGPKFCNMSCCTSYHNLRHPKRAKEGSCALCGQPCSKSRKYCGNSCFHKSVQLRSAGNPPRDRKKDVAKAVTSFVRRTKLKAMAYKGGKCLVCDYSRCVRNMHFHHIDPAQKDFTISSACRAWAKVEAELDKCVLLCANHHGEVHEGLIVLDESGKSWTYIDGYETNGT